MGLDNMVKDLFPVVLFLFGEYILVFLAAMADLWSGVRKARQRGIARTSYRLRRTADKLSRYYNVMFGLTITDCMQILGCWYLKNYCDISVPMFPLMTLLGALGFSLIEIKSIYEKAEDKEKNEAAYLGALVAKIAENKTNPDAIAKAVFDYFNKKNGE
nr:hypothetical protein [Parabacteroides goldsteinii]